MAEELKAPLGGLVGYQVRFTDNVGADTRIKFMTDGILLAEIASDRWLSAYDTIIVDEAHERSLNIDFILGHLRRLRLRRPDLKIVITSATIDTEAFSKAFDGAPTIRVGTLAQPGAAMGSDANDPTAAGEYEVTADLRLSAGESLLLTISPGGATQGAGLIYLTFIPD